MKIEIWSDVVCPWCYIGKRRLERALGEFEHADDVEVTWRSFQLNPDAPRTAVPTRDYLKNRFGPQATAMTSRVAELGRAEGLNLDFDTSLTVNTLTAHRALHFAASQGLGDAAKERLLRAHFSEGADVSDHETLAKLLAEVGVDADRTRAVLAGKDYAIEVRDDIEEADRLGITGVPFFVIDRKYAISGAQPAETFLHALRTAYAPA
jgi:predicted DsbA family dithiol-disulfide isomerase